MQTRALARDVERRGSEMGTRLLFVYGSLMRGGRYQDQLRSVRLLGEVRTCLRWALVSLGLYPALVPGGQAVRGELHIIREGELPRLDDFEDCPELYRRRPIALADGRRADAYVLSDGRAGRTTLDPPDWRAHRTR